MTRLFAVALILSLLLSGCAAAQVGSGAALGAGETIDGMRSVLSGSAKGGVY
jgi:uncharacterized protein YceK